MHFPNALLTCHTNIRCTFYAFNTLYKLQMGIIKWNIAATITIPVDLEIVLIIVEYQQIRIPYPIWQLVFTIHLICL